MRVKLDDGAYLPERAHKTDAGADLRTPVDFTIGPGRSWVVNTGVRVELPRGCYGRIEGKSGLNVCHHIVCPAGIVDEGYTGPIVVKLYNLGDYTYEFKAGDKIAQLIVCPVRYVDFELVEELEKTERGGGGFGSTGR